MVSRSQSDIFSHGPTKLIAVSPGKDRPLRLICKATPSAWLFQIYKLHTQSMPFRPRIAITGGGPSGFALGLLLQQRGINPMIYELCRKPTKQELAKPSGMLDLHEESGLKVMRECGLWEGFQASISECSEVVNPKGPVLHSDNGELSTPGNRAKRITHFLTENVPRTVSSGVKRSRQYGTLAMRSQEQPQSRST